MSPLWREILRKESEEPVFMSVNIRDMTSSIREGRESAFMEFYQLYSSRMLRYLLVVTHGDASAAHEVHQETLLRVIRHMKEMLSDEDLWRFLAVCMRSAWIDHQRSRRHAEQRSKPLDESMLTAESEGQATNQLHELLEQSLADLPEEDRRLINAHYFDGCSQTELAEMQEIPLKTLSMRLVRLRRKMRDFIKEGLSHG
jgi:RNA polymerase sigma-70 factor, ECF subfamily